MADRTKQALEVRGMCPNHLSKSCCAAGSNNNDQSQTGGNNRSSLQGDMFMSLMEMLGSRLQQALVFCGQRFRPGYPGEPP